MKRAVRHQAQTEIEKAVLVKMYTSMLRIRLFEERIAALYPEQEMQCPVHLCIGQEAIAAGVCMRLEEKDYVFSNHRGHGHCLAKGSAMAPLFAEFYGRKTGCSRGKGGSMHVIDVKNGILGTSAIVGGGIPMGVGAALASRIRGDGRVTVIFFGDGASEEGVFYESFNFAALKRLPVVFVCENNFYATNSPQAARQASCRISSAAAAFDAHGVCIDGNDVTAVYEAAGAAIANARDGGEPSLIEAITYRWKGHVGPNADFENGCRPKDELFDWLDRCPIRTFKARLLECGAMTDEEMSETATIIDKEIDTAVAFAKASPFPGASDLLSDVYAGQNHAMD
ncbi:MAG: thiamine pyrophosphate-dependent dehydrogenase E1 component subunit alpha [Deltaproteobacteria bacterium]|nr:thiamine pyrophosphate-dependent dehydrogenase E1 component subunit alpha [Deltaproteobacteria bacterium]